MSKEPDSLIEKKPWYKNTLAIIGIISALAGVIFAIIKIMESSIVSPPPLKVLENIEIILDRSKSMEASFDNSTKIVAGKLAVRESLSYAVSDKDNLSFRLFGGPCLENNSKLEVNFGQQNENKVRKKLESVTTGGKTTLTSAIIEAIGDFNDPDRFDGVNKKIIVITGGSDDCVDAYEKYIEEKLRHKDIKLEMTLIGVGLSDKDKQKLKKLANLKIFEPKGNTYFVNNSAELTQVFKKPRGQKDSNQPPRLKVDSKFLNIASREGNALSVAIESSDPDNDKLHLSAESLPEGSGFRMSKPSVGIFTWTPNKGQAGTYAITFKASDGTMEDSITISITVRPIEIARVEKIARVFNQIALFAFDKSRVNAQSRARLTIFVQDLQNYKQINQIMLNGHTDIIGSEHYNDMLGQRRADAVKVFLIQAGVDYTVISTRSLGLKQPLAENDTPQGRAKNRRVEIEIVAERVMSQ